MRNTKALDAFNALNKIQALAAAAGFLTSSEEEEEMCFRLVDLIERIAREAAERGWAGRWPVIQHRRFILARSSSRNWGD
ncbi:hypothetical protein FXR45_20955 [Salmonella enterica]|nr:hypothetical protein [Salmonella enterica]